MHRWPLLKQGQEKHGMAMKVYRFRMRPVFFMAFYFVLTTGIDDHEGRLFRYFF